MVCSSSLAHFESPFSCCSRNNLLVVLSLRGSWLLPLFTRLPRRGLLGNLETLEHTFSRVLSRRAWWHSLASQRCSIRRTGVAPITPSYKSTPRLFTWVNLAR